MPDLRPPYLYRLPLIYRPCRSGPDLPVPPYRARDVRTPARGYRPPAPPRQSGRDAFDERGRSRKAEREEPEQSVRGEAGVCGCAESEGGRVSGLCQGGQAGEGERRRGNGARCCIDRGGCCIACMLRP